MTAKEHIEDLLQEFLDDYAREHKHKKNLTSDFHAEEGRKTGYKGREILELLQNVDDEYERLCQENPEKKGLEVACLIEYKDNILRVCNTGTAFTEDAIDSICQAATSNKGEKYIGQKGIGFRSVLNWAKEIHIYSGDYSVGFSEEFADEKLNEIARKSETVRMQLERERKNKSSELRIPMLNAPRWIERKTFSYPENYDTIIEIVVKPETQNDDWSITRQIEDFDENILLFLPNLTKINFIVNDKKYSFSKKIDVNDSKIAKLIIESPSRNEQVEYYVYTPKNDVFIESRILKMSIAIPKNGKMFDKPLYTFFPIGKQKCPFNALFHATFDLNDNRETVSSNPINKRIFEELLKFYVDTVTENFCKLEFKNRCLELLCPNNYSEDYSFDSPFNSEDVLSWYLKLCASKSIFLNVNGDFISSENKPKIIDAYFPKYFKGEMFDDLLSPIDASLKLFVNHLIDDTSFSADDLCERINRLSECLTIEQRIEIFAWWIENETNSGLLPNLLQDSKNDFLKFGDRCFFSGEISKLPKWADFKFLDGEYEKNLKSYCLKNDIDLSRYKRFIDFEDFSIENIIVPLNDKVGDDFNRAVEFVKFLYSNFDIIKADESIKEIPFNFPDSDGKVSKATNLYLGKDYGNKFSEEILELTGYRKICSPKVLNAEKSSHIQIENFLIFFGAVKFPSVKKIEVYNINSDFNRSCNYKEYVLHKGSYFEIKGIKTNSICNIENLLNQLGTRSILYWLYNDEQLRKYIQNSNDKAYMRYRKYHYEPRTKADAYSNCEMEIPCYLKYLFSTEKWLEINGGKYSPSECLFSTDSRLSKYYKQCISNDWLKENCGDFSSKELRGLLFGLGMKSKITELGSEQFYSLLLELQNDDNSFEISKQIYTNIVNDDVKEFDNSGAKYKFQNEGKVWTKKNGYQPVSDVFFSGSAVVNVHNKYLIDLPLRTGSKKVMEDVFFIKPYEENYTVEQSSIRPSSFDAEFQKRFYEYLPYVFCYRIETADSTEKKKFQSLKVKIVDAIRIKDDGGIGDVTTPYTLLEGGGNSNQWYIFVKDKSPDWNEISELLKQIFEVLINTQNMNKLDRFCELFVSDNAIRRDFLIEKDLGRISIFEESKKFLYGSESEKEILLKYLKEHNKLSADVNNILDELSFSSFEIVSQQEKLFELLRLVNLDVEDVQKILDRNDISIEQCNLKRVGNYLNKKRKNFEQALYESLKEKSFDEKRLFLSKLSEYDSYHKLNVFEGVNSIRFDVDNVYNQALIQLLGEKKECGSEKLIDIDKFYAGNLESLRKNYGERDVASFRNAIPPETESLLYFDYADVEKELLTWKKGSVEENEKNETNKFEAVDIHFDEVKPVKSASNQNTKTNSGKVSVPRVRNESDKEKQEQGDTAEKDVYDAIVDSGSNRHRALEEKLGVILSEYDMGRISKGLGRKLDKPGEDGLGYDIELINKNKEKENLYIEVKSSKGSACQFDMSKNELDFAEKHSDSYRLIFVGDMEKDRHSIQVLPKQFWQMKEEYEILPKDYTIRCVKK